MPGAPRGQARPVTGNLYIEGERRLDRIVIEVLYREIGGGPHSLNTSPGHGAGYRGGTQHRGHQVRGQPIVRECFQDTVDVS